jgi:hypothetical protein
MLAILVSGALRNFTQIWPQNKAILDSLNLNYDVFIHTWSKNYDTHKSVIRDGNAHRLYLNFKKFKFANESYLVSEKELMSIEGIKEIKIDIFEEEDYIQEFNIDASTRNVLKQSQINSLAMYDGMKRVAGLVKPNIQKYSKFLRLRTDFLINVLSIDLIKKPGFTFFGPHTKTIYGEVSDQCFGGDIKPFFKSMYAFDTFTSHIKEHGWILEDNSCLYAERVFGLHLSLQKDFVASNLEMRFASEVGSIIRPATIKDLETNYLIFFGKLLKHNFSIIKQIGIQLLLDYKRKLMK